MNYFLRMTNDFAGMLVGTVVLSSGGYTKVIDVTTGTPTENTTIPEKVPAKSFVILKK